MVAPESTIDRFFDDRDLRLGEESRDTFMLVGLENDCECGWSCGGWGIMNGTSPVSMLEAISTARKSGVLMSLVMGTQSPRMRPRAYIGARHDQIR